MKRPNVTPSTTLTFLLLLTLVLCSQGLYAQSLLRISFERDEVGKYPSGWQSRDDKNAVKVYSVQAEGDKKLLHADARELSVQISYEQKWDVKDYPILRWRWRPIIFPTGSNEQVKSGADSVLGVYVVLTGLPFVTSIKYLWSDTLPVGATFDSPFSSGTKMLVIRSGRALANTWVSEERNVLADYERLFGKKDSHPTARGIAVLTDSDNTNSRAVGDYADFEILAKRPE